MTYRIAPRLGSTLLVGAIVASFATGLFLGSA